VKLGYESGWRGLFAGGTAAFGGERWSGLVAVSHRQGQETDNQGEDASAGAARSAANPQSRDGRSVLAKLVNAPDADQRFKLTIEGNEDRAETDVMHLRGFQPSTRATTLALLGDDHQTRARVSFAHEAEVGTALADRLDWQLYHQLSETRQRTHEERVTAAGVAQRREREFTFDQRVSGAELTLRKDLALGAAEHSLVYGFDVSRTELRQKRDGRAIDLATGRATNVVPPDVFPVRDFPLSRTTASALFVQDEISLADDALRVIPGLRVDHFALRPQHDPIFAEDNPGLAPAAVSETSVAPKLGAVWQFHRDWSVFANYAHGFRSPPYNDVNLGFTNLQFGYATIPNPDLRPETSDGLELGLRYYGPALQLSLAGFDNRYDDFIESGVVVSRPPESPLLVFQSRNVAAARIRGAELKAWIELGGLADGLRGWSLRTAAAWQQGDDETTGKPLASVDPVRATLGLAYAAETWGVELLGRFAQRKHRLPDATRFAPPGHAVLDLLAHWDLAPDATINIGLFNLADRKYWDWADVGGVAADSAVLDRYTRPGRNVGVSFAVAW
jgi:hemoglobin/transferrin/lactoferrin receptor protein